MSPVEQMSANPPRTDQWHAISASFLGWTLDAFDFFVLVFLVDTLAAQFQVSTEKIIFTTVATLAMRPVGALIFGVLADRYGRRKPLMATLFSFPLSNFSAGLPPITHSFWCYGLSMESGWVESGEWVHRWPWRARRRAGAECSPVSFRADIRLATCSRP